MGDILPKFWSGVCKNISMKEKKKTRFERCYSQSKILVMYTCLKCSLSIPSVWKRAKRHYLLLFHMVCHRLSIQSNQEDWVNKIAKYVDRTCTIFDCFFVASVWWLNKTWNIKCPVIIICTDDCVWVAVSIRCVSRCVIELYLTSLYGQALIHYYVYIF